MTLAEVIPILSQDRPAGGPDAYPHARMRIYQVFVNVEGLEVRVRKSVLGFIPLPRRRMFGFYAVMTLAAPESSRPPLLLSLARDALAEEFSAVSRSSPDEWSCQQLEWRETGVAPPMFQQPGCIDRDWGAAWYDMDDDAAKRHRYRLARARLWKGRRAKPLRHHRDAKVDGGIEE